MFFTHETRLSILIIKVPIKIININRPYKTLLDSTETRPVNENIKCLVVFIKNYIGLKNRKIRNTIVHHNI